MEENMKNWDKVLVEVEKIKLFSNENDILFSYELKGDWISPHLELYFEENSPSDGRKKCWYIKESLFICNKPEIKITPYFKNYNKKLKNYDNIIVLQEIGALIKKLYEFWVSFDPIWNLNSYEMEFTLNIGCCNSCTCGNNKEVITQKFISFRNEEDAYKEFEEFIEEKYNNNYSYTEVYGLDISSCVNKGISIDNLKAWSIQKNSNIIIDRNIDRFGLLNWQ